MLFGTWNVSVNSSARTRSIGANHLWNVSGLSCSRMPAAISLHIPWQSLCTGTTYSHPSLGRINLNPLGATDHRIGRKQEAWRHSSSASQRNLFQAFPMEIFGMQAKGSTPRGRSVSEASGRENNIL